MRTLRVMSLAACLSLALAANAQPPLDDSDGVPWPIGSTPGSLDKRVTLQRAAVRNDLEKIKQLLAANPVPEDIRRALLCAALRRRPEAVQALRAANPPMDVFVAAAAGDLPTLKRLIEQNPADANAHDKLVGRSTLCWAIRSGQKEAVQYLLAHGANANDRSRVDRFDSAIRVAVADEASTEKREAYTQTESPLWSALDGEYAPIDPEVVHLLLERGADASERGPADLSPLARAASKGVVPVVDDLVAHKAKVKAPEYGGVPLLAFAFSSREATARLLKHGADPNGKLPSGDAILDGAVSTPETGVADELIRGGAKVTFKAACILGRVDDARSLLQRNVALATRLIDTEEREGPIFFAARFNQPQIIGLLLEAGARIDPKNRSELAPVHVAAARGSNAALALLLDRGVKVDTESPGGRPINLAAAANKAETVRLLLDRGANVNERSGVSKQTPLVAAAAADADEAAALLIARGADVNARYSELKQTALHVAAWAASVKVTRLLLDKGADRAALDSNRKTALDIARARALDTGQRDADRRKEVAALLSAPSR